MAGDVFVTEGETDDARSELLHGDNADGAFYRGETGLPACSTVWVNAVGMNLLGCSVCENPYGRLSHTNLYRLCKGDAQLVSHIGRRCAGVDGYKLQRGFRFE